MTCAEEREEAWGSNRKQLKKRKKMKRKGEDS